VAAAAGVDPALVYHYFGTKEGLFREALEIPVDPEGLVAEIASAGPEQVPERLVRTFLRVWESPQTGPAMVSLLRRVLAAPESMDLLRNFVGTALVRTAADRLLGDVDATEAEARVGLVLSQLIGVVVARQLLVVGPLASMPIDHLTAALTPTVAHYLRGDLSTAISRLTHDRRKRRQA
jgi:AcrR family transcriptional regulator